MENFILLDIVNDKIDEKILSQVMDYKKEFIENNVELNGVSGLGRVDNIDDWIEINKKRQSITTCPKDHVPSSEYLFVRKNDSKLLGMINIRYSLIFFGHIGYSIRPTEHNKGYGTIMLKLALEKCRNELKEKLINDPTYEEFRVMVTCDKENIGSRRVIEKNNGKLLEEVYHENHECIVQRFWIYL